MVTLVTPALSLSAVALVDLGSAGNFISQACLERLQLRRQRGSQELAVQTIQGRPLGKGKVKYCAPLIVLQVGVLHQEEIQLLVLEDSTVDVILGCPWLAKHSPICSWDPCDILEWGPACRQKCLLPLPTPIHKTLTLAATKVEGAPQPVQVDVPQEYQAFSDVFSEKAATLLPPHRPWDCAIDLVPGAKLPKARVYPLSAPEHKAMESYIQQALRQGFITQSSSPAASSFFFVSKKDGGLRPCIDYRALNAVIFPLPYPLPLVPAALEDLCEARIFTKLDLRSAYNLVRIRKGDEWKTAFITPSGHYEYRVMPYGLSIAPAVFQNFMNEVFRPFLHRFVIVYIDDILVYSRMLREHHQQVTQILALLQKHQLYLNLPKCEFHRSEIQFLGYVINAAGIRMDERKVAAVRDWPVPASIKELQRFLGFANFYRRFIGGFSLVSAPLTSLLRGKAKTLSWTPEAQRAFEELRKRFCAAPLLRHPDPQLPFIVEVDASSTGVGATLSQQAGTPPRLHPCAYFSKKLSPAEQNYDIGNRELLAIKLALEEWRHWLEGAAHPFMVITDHKNLQYLREAKRLNPRQAQWALFFTRFKFSITYRPTDKEL
ncbi:hypothetical protein C0J50_10790 [Silurus asotus]|uniref:ribonuclease H n=1 Tax=Silurus asotus TaxID=30991 RepID=A0AAD5AG74_SILAS|nr:hypothetical protein C0J50_10790 [Silurus asotus]